MFKIVVATVLSGLAALMADSMSPAATPVSGATEPQYAYTNRLIHEKSPYLLQHAHNPVDWYPWGAEAFVQARKEIKPIFLSVDYSTCHWCHVMERESFENPAIARILNDNFVCIKVDREERPDVNGVYMTFVQATAGGGWPLTVWVFIEDWAKLQVYRHLDLKAKLHFKFLDRVHEPLHAHKL